MIYGLIIAFLPLFLGYLLVIKNLKWLNLINRTTFYCLYLILLLMGVSLGQLDDLGTKLPQIVTLTFGISLILHSCNIMALIIFDKCSPMPQVSSLPADLPSRWHILREAMQLCLTIFIGAIIGFFSKGIIDFPLHTSTYVLVIMIFCVGVQLRNSGTSLKIVFLNKRGLFTAFIFILSCLAGGIICAYLFDIPLNQSLAIASGFGWYTLSSVLIHDAWGAMYGSIAFFNDLSREIFCLFTIPLFMRLFPSTAVGLGGATTLDVSLPLIQKSGGIQIVPLALSFGFLTNLIAPILMAFFIGLD